jgi:hypothetical protein
MLLKTCHAGISNGAVAANVVSGWCALLILCDVAVLRVIGVLLPVMC